MPRTFHKRQRSHQAGKPAAPSPGALQSLLDTLADYEPRIGQGDVSLAAHVWRYYPMAAGAIRIAERAIQDAAGGQLRVSGAAIVAKSRLDTLHTAAVELLTRVAEGFGIDPTPLFVSAQIARRVYGADCGDCFTVDPVKVRQLWPDCLEKDIARLERHERATVRKSGPLLQRLLLKNKRAKPENDPGEMMLLTAAQRVFGFKSAKELTCFLDRHRQVKQDRPLTETGKPHQRRRLVDVVTLCKAISRDDAIMSDPARRARMQARLKNARLAKDLEDKALTFLTGKSK